MNVTFSEGAFKYILKETLKKEQINEHVDEIFNVNSAIKIIEKQWESPDDFWYVYISQRKKDNLGAFVKNHNSAGSRNFSVNFIAYGIVQGNSKEEAIESLKNIKMMVNYHYQDKISTKGNRVSEVPSVSFPIQAVVVLCNKFNARCYMTVNKRSMSETNSYANNLKQRGLEKNREFQFAAGRQMTHNDQVNDWERKRPYGIIDCDIDDVNAQKELEDFLAKHNIPIFDKYQTHDGVHYVLNNRDANRLNFSRFDDKYRVQNAAKTRRNSDPMVLFKGDACILLYSACGY